MKAIPLSLLVVPVLAAVIARGAAEPAPGASSLFQSVVTEANLDLANTAEFPPHPAAKGGFNHAASRTEGLLGALHIRGPLSPHGSWLTDETDQPRRFLRLAFNEPLPVGTVIGAGGNIGYLKAEAPFPGDVTQDEHWVAVPATQGQAGQRVVVFPPGVVTRALRFAFHDALPQGGKSRSGFGGALLLQARLHNLTPEATAFASSQPAGGANVVEATRVQNLVTGGSWSAAPKQDVSPEHPEWVVLSWPEAKNFSGVGFFNAFAKVLEIEALNAAETGHPATTAAAWTKVGTLTWPIWWRPAYTDAFVPFIPPVTTRALRVRITHPLTNEDQDIGHTTQGNRRTVRLGGVMAFANLVDAPVPPRPKVAAEPAPIVLPLTMPHDGKLVVAIDSAEGRRVRNLVAEVDRLSGPIVERWDGRDDAGRTVAPGTYTVKALTRRPLHLTYQATVNCSGNPPWWRSGSWGDQAGPGSWLSDHAPPNDVTSIGERTFVGAVIAESGHTILACDPDGNKVWGAKWLETAGAGYLTSDGKKVYSAGEGGWIGDRLFIHEIDPLTFKWRRVTQLDFDTGNTPGGGVSGIAARDGKLYVAFNRPPLPWLRSAIATANVDEKNTTSAYAPHGGDLLGLLRTRGDIPAHGAWKAEQSSDPAQHLRIAFKTPQPVGTLVTPDAVEVSALRAEVAYPGDVTKDEQWIPFARAAGAIHCYVAPAGLTTRAIRFTSRKAADDGKVWQSQLGGALLLSRRFTHAMAGAVVTVSAGQATADGSWTAVTEQPITRTSPVMLMVSWPEAKRFRGLGFLNAFAKRIAVDAYTGTADVDPAKAPETAWTNLGEVTPAVRWRPAYSDDYFDAGKDVIARGIRLRVVEPWVNENIDIAAISGGKPTRAALGGLVVFQHLGDDPAEAEAVPSQRLSVADIAAGKWERHHVVPTPQFPHFDAAGNLVLVSGRQVVRMSLADGALTPIVKDGLAEPRGIAFDAAGNLFVADAGPKVVRVFSPEGKPLRVIGKPGGRQVGAYDPNCFGNLHGITIDSRGRLWVAEPDYQPKRTSLWDVKTGRFLDEFIGPAQYGGGGFLDPQDKSRFYYTGMEFAIDWKTGGWKVKNILTRNQPAFSGGHTDHPVYLNGQQYMVNDPGVQGANGQLLLVGKFRKDRVVPLSAAGNAELWGPFTSDPALAELVAGKLLNTLSFVWADADGDGLPQPEEVTISPPGVRLSSTYWPTLVNKQLMVQMGGRLLNPSGYSPCGAPVYQPFRDEAKLPAFPAENIYATAVDGNGRVVVNGRPVLAINPDGKVDWSYPQRWVGVHDSHHAPSPQPGQLVGGLGFVGQAEVPGVGETLMLSGNKGEWYLFTADGLLAATLWHDYRKPGVVTWNFPKAERGMPLDRVTVGEEHFGGGYTGTSDGKYYLIAGHNHNSIAELTGMESLQRQGTTVTLTPDDITACEAWAARQTIAQAQTESPRIITAATANAPVTADGNLQEWVETPFTPIGNRGSFAVRADAKYLYLAFQVNSGGLPRNGGDDVKMLFKTGDSVDLQIGVDAQADPRRTTPEPGDQRLLITRFEEQPVGVLYKHRVPDTPQAERTPFASPWRTAYVDKIVRLDPANIGITRTPKGYAVEAAVPLALLGLTPQPGASYKADFGILTADTSGVATQVRSYWANPATGVVSDVPSEIMLTPGLWGTLIFPAADKP